MSSQQGQQHQLQLHIEDEASLGVVSTSRTSQIPPAGAPSQTAAACSSDTGSHSSQKSPGDARVTPPGAEMAALAPSKPPPPRYGKLFSGSGLTPGAKGKQATYVFEGSKGIGGSSRVFPGWKKDSTYQSKVVLKRVFGDHTVDGACEKTKRETKVLQQLQHENIIPLVDAHVEVDSPSARGATFLVYPYVEHDLAALLESKHVVWEVPLIKLFARQMLAAVAHLHQSEFVHRNLEPTNILISNDGVLKVGGFGSAREAPSGWYTTTTTRPKFAPNAPTRWYKSPEFFLGFGKYGTGTDIWAVGCLLGEMLTKRPILQGNSDQDQLRKIWALCGPPSTENFPEFDEHGGCPADGDEPVLGQVSDQRHVAEEFAGHGAPYGDLIDQCLALNPASRTPADSLLKHCFFASGSQPAATKFGSLKWCDSSHSGGRRFEKGRSNSSAQAVNAASRSASTSLPKRTRPAEPPASQASSSRPSAYDVIVLDDSDDERPGPPPSHPLAAPDVPDMAQAVTDTQSPRTTILLDERQLFELKNALAAAERRSADQCAVIEQGEHKVRGLQTLISEQQKTISQLNVDTRDLRFTINTQARKLQEEVGHARSGHAKAEAALAALHQRTTEAQTENASLQRVAVLKDEEIRRLEADKAAAQKDVMFYSSALLAAKAEIDSLTADVERRTRDTVALAEAAEEMNSLAGEIQKCNATIYFGEIELAKIKEEISTLSAEAYRDGKLKAAEETTKQTTAALAAQEKLVEDLRAELKTHSQALEELSQQLKSVETRHQQVVADLQSEAQAETNKARRAADTLLQSQYDSIQSLKEELVAVRAEVADRDDLLNTAEIDRVKSRKALDDKFRELERTRKQPSERKQDQGGLRGTSIDPSTSRTGLSSSAASGVSSSAVFNAAGFSSTKRKVPDEHDARDASAKSARREGEASVHRPLSPQDSLGGVELQHAASEAEEEPNPDGCLIC